MLAYNNQSFANTSAQSPRERCLAVSKIKVSCAPLLFYFSKPDNSTCAGFQRLKGFFTVKTQGILHVPRVSALADHSYAITSKPARRHSKDLQGDRVLWLVFKLVKQGEVGGNDKNQTVVFTYRALQTCQTPPNPTIVQEQGMCSKYQQYLSEWSVASTGHRMEIYVNRGIQCATSVGFSPMPP